MLKRKASTHTFVVILLTLVSLSLSHSSFPKILSAETINVPEDYPTIQAAIDAATAGDTILVAPGTYYENLVIAKSLTLRGAGSEITITDGGGRGTGVKITADSVNMSGFTIRNSVDGVHLYQCNGVTVSGNKIDSNKNDGVYVESSDGNTIRGNTITSNKLEGLLTEYSSDNTISDNLVTSNTEDGVHLLYSSNNTVSGNIITSHASRPAISLEGSDGNTVSNNTIWSNKFGISLYYVSSENTVVGNTIWNSSYVGIELYEAGGNTFHHNNFFNMDQVFIDMSVNTWDNGAEGNYWSNYNGTGPHVVDKDNQDQDRYPLINPYDETKPVADAGPDQLVQKGAIVTFDGSKSSDNLDIVDYGIVDYTWTFTDNATQVLTGVEANYTFRNVDNFSVTLNVSDYSGNWDTDQMWVNVTETRLIRDVAITCVTPFLTTVTTGDLLLINVTVANQGNMSETFNLTVYYDSSVVGRKSDISLASGANNTLSFNWNTTGVPGGNYTIKAVASIVAGETDTADNEDIDDKVIIERLSSTILISAFPQTITLGNSTVINGSIIPRRVEVNVTIQYRLSEGNWSELKNVTTDTGGRYSYEWTPTTIGTYDVKASWPGDATTLPAENYVWNITVKEGPANDIYLYAVAIAAVIVLSATAVYVLKVRKPRLAQQPREHKL